MKKRVLSALVAVCLVLGLSPATALAVGESATGVQLMAVAEADGGAGIQPLAVDASAVSPVITLADAGACRYHHGNDLGSITSSNWDGPGRGSYDRGTVTVTNSGNSATVYFKERAHFKNADYMLQPFTLSVKVPANTIYVVTFDVDISLIRNAKGNTWYFVEMADNTDGAAYNATFSAGANSNLLNSSRFRSFGNGSSYSPSTQISITFTNDTGADATVTEPGYEKFTCPDCGAVVETALPALEHDFGSTWEIDETNGTHYHICGNGCGVRKDEAPHVWNDGVTAGGKITYTCTDCGATKEETAPPAPTYSVTYRLDDYTVGDKPTQADAAEGETITLPSGGLTRTGYTLAGWLLLDEAGLPGGQAMKGSFNMLGRDVTFQVSWKREASYSLQNGDTVVLEDGTVIHRNGDTITIDQGGDGTPDTTIALPENANPVLKQGSNGEKDKITIPKETEVTTGNGPTITLGTGGGTVDTEGNVDAPAGSTVEDDNGNKTTITDGTGTINPDGTITFPEGEKGKITVEDENGNKTTIGGGTGTVNPDGTVTFPGGGKLTVEDSEGNATEVTVNPGGTVDPENPNPPSGSSGSSSTPIYRPIVEQPDEGGSAPAVSPSNPKRGDKVIITPKPDLGYGVENVTVTDRNGNPVAVTKNPDGTYSFTQPSGRVTISVTYQETGAVCDGGVYCPSRVFTDLSATAWYHEATDFVLASGIMNGYADGTFHPNSTLSRAMLCQILYNLEGRPAISGGAFSDVPKAMWCADAVAWANANGIVTGYGDGTFRPNNPITREQLAAMLWRYTGSPESDHTLEQFTDAGQISGYARTALAWANETGVVNGFGDGTVNPRGTATRAQTAQMLMNFLAN